MVSAAALSSQQAYLCSPSHSSGRLKGCTLRQACWGVRAAHAAPHSISLHQIGSGRRSRHSAASHGPPSVSVPSQHVTRLAGRCVQATQPGSRGARLGAASTEVHSPTEQPTGEAEVAPGVYEGFWQWQPPGSSASYRIRYQRCGESGPPALMVHGFGGNWCVRLPRHCPLDLVGVLMILRVVLRRHCAGCDCTDLSWRCLPPPHLTGSAASPRSDHWRKNLPVVGQQNRAYAIDLIGYGYSDKPDPRWRSRPRCLQSSPPPLGASNSSTPPSDAHRACPSTAAAAAAAQAESGVLHFRELGRTAARLY